MIADDRCRRRRRRRARVTHAATCSTTTSSSDVVHRPVGRSSRSTSCSTPAAAWPAWSRRSCSTGCPAGRRGSASRSTARFPNHEANPLIEENRRDIVERVIAREGRHRHRLGRRRRPLLLHRRQRRVHLRRLHHRAARRGVPAEAPGRDDHLRPARQLRGQGHRRALRRHGADEPRRPRVLQAADARGPTRIFGGEVTGHYYFRDFFYADNGFIPALLILELMSKKGQTLRELLAPLREQVLHLRRDQHQAGRAWTRCRPSSTAIAAQYADGTRYTLDGVSVEYPDWHFNVRAVEHRAAAAPEPRSDDAGADGRRSATRCWR